MINIVTCCWNASAYIERCINSVLAQSYSNYRMFIIDDKSDDNTSNLAKNTIKTDTRFNIYTNYQQQYKLKNYDLLIRDKTLIHDNDIIIELDGDDFLYHTDALKIIQKYYQDNPNLLIANSKFIYDNGRPGFSNFVDIENIRMLPFCFSHLRSWKSILWRAIDIKYFIDPSTDNTFFPISADMAYSLPMLEIAGQTRYTHIPDTLLVYNDSSPYNDHKPGSGSGGRIKQLQAERIIRNMPKHINTL